MIVRQKEVIIGVSTNVRDKEPILWIGNVLNV